MARLRRILNWTFGSLGALVLTTAFVPEVLAFPYRQTVGDTTVYSEMPLPASFPQVLAGSDRLLRTSPIYGPGYGRRVFLTDGGWRWRVLALRLDGAFAFSRPFAGVIVVNRSDPARGMVFNGAPIAGRRSLAAVIAHEQTHGLIRARYGSFADVHYPEWLREGYCDVVAGGGTLSDHDAAMLKARHVSTPALRYYDARKRVEALLREKRGSVDELFQGQ